MNRRPVASQGDDQMPLPALDPGVEPPGAVALDGGEAFQVRRIEFLGEQVVGDGES